jgi:hypothetical protein
MKDSRLNLFSISCEDDEDDEVLLVPSTSRLSGQAGGRGPKGTRASKASKAGKTGKGYEGFSLKKLRLNTSYYIQQHQQHCASASDSMSTGTGPTPRNRAVILKPGEHSQFLRDSALRRQRGWQGQGQGQQPMSSRVSEGFPPNSARNYSRYLTELNDKTIAAARRASTAKAATTTTTTTTTTTIANDGNLKVESIPIYSMRTIRLLPSL